MAAGSLNERQRDVLEWIAAGCPERQWPNYAHRTSARMLAARGLVKVKGNGPSWTATITDQGLAYLKGDLARDKSSSKRSKPTPKVRTPAPESVGTEDRPRRGTSSATGKKTKKDPPPAIPVPTVVDLSSPVMSGLRDAQGDMAVSADSRERALLILQALLEEFVRRGHKAVEDQEGPVLRLDVFGIAMGFKIHEEKEKARVVPEEVRPKLKYEWQRAVTRVERVWTGRLLLTLVDGSLGPPPHWADRKRWTLDSRLPYAVEEATTRASIEIERRSAHRRADQAKYHRRKNAVPAAKHRYLEQLNRERLEAQLQAHSNAVARRSYADAVEQRASELPESERDAALGWAQWIREEAQRTDPVMSGEQLHYERPQDIPHHAFEKYLPSNPYEAHRWR